MRQTERNFSFFGAPVGLIFSIDRRLKPHSWIDLGLFAQNLMIAAKARGIDTCPQVAFAQFHDQIGVLRPEQVGEDPARVVGVVEEEHEVTQTDQGVGTLAGSGQVTGVAVHIADHVYARLPVSGRCGCHDDQE
jgi:nitroreductase